MGWMPQPKDKGWLNGYKSKIPIYAVYKKPTSDLKTHLDWKWEHGKIYSMQMGSKRKLEQRSISDKIELKIKIITREKEWHNIMTKGSIQEEDRTTVNIYAPNRGAPQYIKQTLSDVNLTVEKLTVTQ